MVTLRPLHSLSCTLWPRPNNTRRLKHGNRPAKLVQFIQRSFHVSFWSLAESPDIHVGLNANAEMRIHRLDPVCLSRPCLHPHAILLQNSRCLFIWLHCLVQDVLDVGLTMYFPLSCVAGLISSHPGIRLPQIRNALSHRLHHAAIDPLVLRQVEPVFEHNSHWGSLCSNSADIVGKTSTPAGCLNLPQCLSPVLFSLSKT